MSFMPRSHSHRIRYTAVAFVLLLLVLVVALAGAEETDDAQAALLVPYAPTTAELMTMPPSIERYVAAHTLPLSARTETGIDRVEASLRSFMPLTTFGLLPQPGQLTLTVGVPNGFNAWPVSWSADSNATSYELQEAHQSDFSDGQISDVGTATSLTLTKVPSPENVYYYRVRSRIGGTVGPWSNEGRVVGGFRDDFEDPNSGWSMRRTTYIEEVHGRYQDGKYVLDVNDRWDWGISSPGKPAPRVPYVIDFWVMVDDGGANLWSFGAVFGGDWPAARCPMATDADGWYKHGDCFNHFYNTNIIMVYAAKLGFEPVLQYTYRDTRYVNDDYFGLFASTDEYTNGIWWFDNFQVMPLD